MGIQNFKEQSNKKNVIVSILKILLLGAIVIGIPLYIYFFEKEWISQFRDFDDIIAYLQSYRLESIPIYIYIQVTQIIISIIPGQIFNLAAGYLYTFFPALLFSIIGAFVGTLVSFWIARWLGSDFVHIFFGREKTQDYVKKLNSKKAYTIVFFIYLIPGIPKDVVSYAAGVSDMKFKPFMLLSLIGRLPGMMGSIMIGSMWHKEEYIGMIILAVLAITAFILCIVFRKKINKFLDEIYEKISS
ncbi:MAG: VTT domain-containing protein [Anaerovoracaceae bacterium]|nr:TVP38/TMEM64 family protein [Bacillota bacterium]MEE0517374.1 VTT domain-containing protein [Anaerovoracaceae bacterium]